MQPYFVLGISPNADDETIRQAYLAAVKESPPDVNPERFQVISAAYAQIKDEQARLRHHFLRRDQPGGSPLGALVCLRSKDSASALARAQRSWTLRHSPQAARLAFLACVSLGDDSAALRWRQRAQRAR
jgi:curved DNA-binding protein CbpA